MSRPSEVYSYMEALKTREKKERIHRKSKSHRSIAFDTIIWIIMVVTLPIVVQTDDKANHYNNYNNNNNNNNNNINNNNNNNNYEKNFNYDYYGDYDGVEDDINYAELGPPLYESDDKKEQSAERSKKAAKIPLAADNSKDCEPETTTPPPKPAVDECATEAPTACPPTGLIERAFQAPKVNNDQEQKSKELRELVQHLYISQARVQLEASEIKKAQAIANEAQQQLEESANHVRAVTAALQNAQQEVASSAIRAQTAQLQLAAHDQLLFAARQDVDALSSRMVGLQAAEGIAQPKVNFDIGALMQKLRQPLMEAEKPTPVPSIAFHSQTSHQNNPSDSYFYYEYADDKDSS